MRGRAEGTAARPRRGRVTVVAIAALLVLGGAGAGSATTAQGQATLYDGLGFDACNAPPVASLQAWLASPYRAVGIYIGGGNRACANAQLSAAWVTAAEGLGYALAPLYVGPQAPCSDQSGVTTIAPDQAGPQGTAAADAAIASASALGLPAASPIYYDMEAYALDNPACTQTVQTFLSAWVDELHAQGYLAGVYGSASSTMRDLQALTTTSATPDDVWIADWDGDTSVFGDPYVSDAIWTNHQRIHQFSGGHPESYGGVTIDIDGDAFDGAVVGAAGGAQAVAPAPTTTTTTTGTTPTPAPASSTAGSVTSSDGVAQVSWPAGAFQQSVVVSLTPSLPSQPVAGFASGGYGVLLQVQQTGTTTPLTTFAAPLTIHIDPQPGVLAPVGSTNGTSWSALPELVGGLLPVGVEAAYAREPDGSVEIQTRTAGAYALLPDPTPPPAPGDLRGHFDHGSLVLEWSPSPDPTGNPVAYQVTLTNQPLLTVTGQTVAALRAFHPDAPSVYRIRALDAAGNLSAPSEPLVVLPSRRPRSVPRAVPGWAWQVFTWQQNGSIGPRPAAPSPLPAWYWPWRAWRIAPFHLRA